MPRAWDLVCKYCGEEYVAGRAPREGEFRSCKKPDCRRRRNSESHLEWERRFKEKNGYWSARRFKVDKDLKIARDGKRLAEKSARERDTRRTTLRRTLAAG